VTRDELIELVRSHRRRWPIVRILNDPPGFRAECEALLRDLPTDEVFPPHDWIDDTWLDRLFKDRPSETSRIDDQRAQSSRA
jgi:hypothetical protein